MREIWKDIIGYEGLYQVSNLGSVKRITSANNQYKEGYILKFNMNKGYCHVQLHKDSKVKGFRVHRLVAFAFIPNNENKPHINHINGVKNDNRIENLEWCTPSENELHRHQVLGKTHRKYIYSEPEINEIKKLYLNGERLKSIAKKFNTTTDSIHKVIVKHIGKVNYKGQFNGSAKLKDSDNEKILALFNSGLKYVEIAPIFNVSYQTISRRIKGINL